MSPCPANCRWTVCQYDLDALMCKPNSTEDYIDRYLRIKDAAEMRLEAATADTSVDYAWVRMGARNLLVAWEWMMDQHGFIISFNHSNHLHLFIARIFQRCFHPQRNVAFLDA